MEGVDVCSSALVVHVSDETETVFFYVNQQNFFIEVLKDGTWAPIKASKRCFCSS